MKRFLFFILIPLTTHSMDQYYAITYPKGLTLKQLQKIGPESSTLEQLKITYQTYSIREDAEQQKKRITKDGSIVITAQTTSSLDSIAIIKNLIQYHMLLRLEERERQDEEMSRTMFLLSDCFGV